MALEDIDHIMRQIEALVPEGRVNRQGMRVWREILGNIRFALTNALDAIALGNGAQVTADAALAQANANLTQITINAAGINTNATAIANINVNVNTVIADLAAHEALGAGAGVIGHVSQGAAPPGATVALPGAAPPAYNAAHSQAIVDAHADLVARFDALAASLAGTGIVA
jgi:hypothetical protein